MMLEFGVDLEDFDEPRDLIESMRGRNFWLYDVKIYVAKESEHIFEPKKNDIVFYKNNLGLWLGDSVRKSWAKEGIGELYDYQHNIVREQVEKLLPKIIIRDNKQFFMPKQEENE
jgi:hypothetical protein